MEQFQNFRSAYQVEEFLDKLTTSLHPGPNTNFNQKEFDFIQIELTENKFFRLPDVLLKDNDVYLQQNTTLVILNNHSIYSEYIM